MASIMQLSWTFIITKYTYRKESVSLNKTIATTDAWGGVGHAAKRYSGYICALMCCCISSLVVAPTKVCT